MASLKGWCIHCRGEISGSAVRRNVPAPCPHCGREVAPSSAVAYRRRFHPDRRGLWLVIGLTGLLVMGLLSYFFWRQIKSGFYLLADETGSATAALAFILIVLFLLFCLVLWMVLPFVLFSGLRDLRRRTTDLEETGRVCARHLARLSAEPGYNPKEEKTANQG